MTIVEAIILAIIEGITEFLPISSTGHMIIGSSLMGIAEDPFTKAFTVVIQFGAILSVIVLYWRRFFQSANFYLKLFVGFIPAAIFGKLFNDSIDALLENVFVVGLSLFLGGIILLFIDKWFQQNEQDKNNEISYFSAFKIGLFQCIAMIPGISRSAATIVGGLAQGLNRKTAAEFSFFLAIPTMLAAGVYKIYKLYSSGYTFGPEQIKLLAVGNLVAFLVALLAIKAFIGFLTKHGFRAFGYYRIVVGLIIILAFFAGYELKIV